MAWGAGVACAGVDQSARGTSLDPCRPIITQSCPLEITGQTMEMNNSAELNRSSIYNGAITLWPDGGVLGWGSGVEWSRRGVPAAGPVTRQPSQVSTRLEPVNKNATQIYCDENGRHSCAFHGLLMAGTRAASSMAARGARRGGAGPPLERGGKSLL